MQSRYWIIKVFFYLLISVLIAMSVNLLVDPYQIYKKHNFGFLGNERYQIAGLISSYLNNQDDHYDTIIVGTSMSQNFTPSAVAKTLKNKGTLKLTISGSTPIMKEYVIKEAINTSKVENIILEIYESYADSSSNNNNENKLPLYLYQKNNLTKFTNYILNIDILISSIELLVGTKSTTIKLDNYQNWMGGAEKYFTRFNSCSNLDSIKKDKKIYQFSYIDYFPHLDKIIKIIKNNKSINFTIFFPPYSRLHYYNMNNNKINKNLSMRRYLVSKLKHIQNVNIYAFDNMSFTADLKNYKDTGHYRMDVNDRIIKMIANNIGLIDFQNIKIYENNFMENLSNYKTYSSAIVCNNYKIKPLNKSQY